jgi:hypothetical protein
MLNKIMNALIDFFFSDQWDHHVDRDGIAVMRRRLPGRWEYRSPTAEELEELWYYTAAK